MERDDAVPFDELDEATEAALDEWRSGGFDDFDLAIPPLDGEERESDVPSDLDPPAVGEASSLASVPPGAGARGDNPLDDVSPTADPPDLPAEDRELSPELAAWIAAKEPRPIAPASDESIAGAADAIAAARSRTEPGPLESLFTARAETVPPPSSATPEAPPHIGAPSPPPLGGGAPEAPGVAPDPLPEASDPPAAPSPLTPSPGDGAARTPTDSDPAPPARPAPEADDRGRGVGGSTRPAAEGEPLVVESAEPDTGTPPAPSASTGAMPLGAAPPANASGGSGAPAPPGGEGIASESRSDQSGPANDSFLVSAAPSPPGAPHRDETLATAMAPQLGLELGVAHDRAPAVRLTDLFVVPPFSTLDSRADYWKKRKTGWLSLGIQSEVGRSASPYHSNGDGGSGVPSPASVLGRRDGLTLQSDTVRDPTFYAKKRAAEKRAGRELSLDEFRRDHYTPPETPAASISNTGTSVFDPVLCEVAYRWFSPPGGVVLDPFAGGSVRGVVASVLGRRYVGVELRPEQVHANRVNAGEIVGPEAAWDFGGSTPMPAWVEGSATDLRAIVPRGVGGGLGGAERAGSLPRDGADLVFTCPPYADLEVYSDDPRDLSTAPYPVFRAMLSSAMAQSVELLRPDRFAIWVVGEARDPRTGYSYGIVADTVAAARAAGLGLYNEAILYTAIASAAMRATNQHRNSRKLVRVHQHVLVFAKGDPKRAADACGDPQLGG